MSDEPGVQRAELAAAFDLDLDPLADFESTFRETDVDPFDLFVAEILDSKDITPRTRNDYHRVFRQWREHMVNVGRHPACPDETHVRGFMEREYDQKGNHPDTIFEKVRKLQEVYQYWQDDPTFPHPSDYDPFALTKRKVSFDEPDEKQLPRISIPELRAILSRITNVRDLAIVTIQLKLGLRATEVCNLAVAEVDLQSSELQRHYAELGTHWMLDDRPNALYIPHDRYGNKSGRPRVLPLDRETRGVLSQYLLVRPDNGQPWLFLSEKGNQLTREYVTEIWKRAFHPEYEETERNQAVTSHYGRHRFTTYWRVEQGLSRPLLKYMRGDRPDSESVTDRDGIDEYIHAYYEDIESLYRRNIYPLFE